MKNETRRNHSVDFLFPVILFFIFSLCALTVILLAAGVYKDTTESSSLNYSARTSLSYISEKVHQSDNGGNIQKSSFGDEDALMMESTIDNQTYETYIYVDGGELKELFALKGADVNPSSGTAILEVSDFEVKEIKDNLIQVTCVDENNQKASCQIAVRSGN